MNAFGWPVQLSAAISVYFGMDDLVSAGVRIYQPTRRERSAFLRRRYGPFVLAFGLIGLALGGALGLRLSQFLAMTRDTEGAVWRSGLATVSSVAWPTQMGTLGSRPVGLDYEGTKVWVNSDLPFYARERVFIRYRVGRSGRLYVMEAVPLPVP